MKIKPILQNVFYLMAIGISLFLLFFVITTTWIGYDVQSQCQSAKRQYEGDCVEALISVLNDDHQSFRTRNSAIWALGKLGDKRSLSVLESYYTGIIPEREPLDEGISQYELKKAIQLADGGLNISAFMWRYSILKK